MWRFISWQHIFENNNLLYEKQFLSARKKYDSNNIEKTKLPHCLNKRMTKKKLIAKQLQIYFQILIRTRV